MDLLNVLFIAGWLITAVIMAYNVRSLWRPLPRSFGERRKRFEEAMHAIEASDLTDFEKDLGLLELDRTQSIERLRLYARFGSEFSITTIDSLASSLRINYTRLLTNMTPSRITRDHLAVYERFVLLRREINFTPDSVDDEVNRNRKDLSRTAVYAMTHMDQADEIITIMADRKVYNLKQVKSLLGKMSQMPNSDLAEGVL